MQIYLAGPLFTAAEREFNAQLAALLRGAGHQVWLSQEHDTMPLDPVAIFGTLLTTLEASDVLLANMDGADPDSGTSWECGYVYAKRKPSILFRTDFRRDKIAALGPYNLMLWVAATVRLDGPYRTAIALVGDLQPKLHRDFLAHELAVRPALP